MALLAQFRAIAVPRDGDCLFSSVAKSIKTARREMQNKIAANAHTFFSHPRELRQRGFIWSAQLLRDFVAASVLKPDMSRDEALKVWHHRYQSAKKEGVVTEEDFPHMSDVTERPVTPTFRRQVWEVLRDRKRYWGDEIAILALEQILGIRIVVMYKNRVAKSHDHGHDFAPVAFVVTRLRHQHYEPLVFTNGKMLFTFRELPLCLVQKAQECFPKSPYWYISLTKDEYDSSDSSSGVLTAAPPMSFAKLISVVPK